MGTTPGRDGRPTATRWEIIGYRLRIWTPPRDVEIPPVSWRKVWMWVAAITAAIAIVVIFVAPAIDSTKQRRAAEERRAEAASLQRARVRLIAEQRAHHGRSAAVARLYAAGEDVAAREALLADVSGGVGDDARARVAAGRLDGPIRSMRCSYRSGAPAGVRVQLDCLAVTSVIGDAAAPQGYIGHPFVAAASLRDGRYAWCKENPPSGEGLAGRGVAVALPAECIR